MEKHPEDRISYPTIEQVAQLEAYLHTMFKMLFGSENDYPQPCYVNRAVQNENYTIELSANIKTSVDLKPVLSDIVLYIEEYIELNKPNPYEYLVIGHTITVINGALDYTNVNYLSKPDDMMYVEIKADQSTKLPRKLAKYNKELESCDLSYKELERLLNITDSVLRSQANE